MYRNFFTTKKGYGDLVVMSIEAYEQIVETQLIDNAISEAEEEYEKTGVLLDAKDTLASLRISFSQNNVKVELLPYRTNFRNLY